MDLALHVKHAAKQLGIDVKIAHYLNPRVEMEEHYYNPDHKELFDLGLKPHLLNETLVESVIKRVIQYKDRVVQHSIVPRIYWKLGDTEEYTEILDYEENHGK